MFIRPALMVHVVHREVLVRHEKKKGPHFFDGLSPVLYLHYMSFKHNHSEVHTVYIFSTVTLNHTVVSHDSIGTLFRQCLYRL